MEINNTNSNAGAKQYDVVMMFKVMVLRQYYNLSYEQTEYQIIDRSSFKKFLGLAALFCTPTLLCKQ